MIIFDLIAWVVYIVFNYTWIAFMIVVFPLLVYGAWKERRRQQPQRERW